MILVSSSCNCPKYSLADNVFILLPVLSRLRLRLRLRIKSN
nr:MAG TPA: hypothetical protein [Caudoviricetes sp.]